MDTNLLIIGSTMIVVVFHLLGRVLTLFIQAFLGYCDHLLFGSFVGLNDSSSGFEPIFMTYYNIRNGENDLSYSFSVGAFLK